MFKSALFLGTHEHHIDAFRILLLLLCNSCTGSRLKTLSRSRKKEEYSGV
ncbi:hypothetical protein ALT785_620016 [Alteromonas infernus]